MYFRPNLNSTGYSTCAFSKLYNTACILSWNNKKVKKVDKIKFLGVIIVHGCKKPVAEVAVLPKKNSNRTENFWKNTENFLRF